MFHGKNELLLEGFTGTKIPLRRGHLDAESGVPRVRAVVVGRHRGLDGGMRTRRVPAAGKTAMSSDKPLANGRDTRRGGSVKRCSADGRAGETYMFERA